MRKLYIFITIGISLAIGLALLLYIQPGAGSPEEVVEEYWRALKTGDVESLQVCLGGEYIATLEKEKEEIPALSEDLITNHKGIKLLKIVSVDQNIRGATVQAYLRKGKDRRVELYSLKKAGFKWKITFKSIDGMATEELNNTDYGIMTPEEEKEYKKEMFPLQYAYEEALEITKECNDLINAGKQSEAIIKLREVRNQLEELLKEHESDSGKHEQTFAKMSSLLQNVRQEIFRCEMHSIQ